MAKKKVELPVKSSNFVSFCLHILVNCPVIVVGSGFEMAIDTKPPGIGWPLVANKKLSHYSHISNWLKLFFL